jgi:hypothetical protein
VTFFPLQDVRHALSDLEAANQELSGIIEKVSNEHRHRAEIVRHHPHEIGLERQVGTSGCLAQIFLFQPGLSTSPYWDRVGLLEVMLVGCCSSTFGSLNPWNFNPWKLEGHV